MLLFFRDKRRILLEKKNWFTLKILKWKTKNIWANKSKQRKKKRNKNKKKKRVIHWQGANEGASILARRRPNRNLFITTESMWPPFKKCGQNKKKLLENGIEISGAYLISKTTTRFEGSSGAIFGAGYPSLVLHKERNFLYLIGLPLRLQIFYGLGH